MTCRSGKWLLGLAVAGLAISSGVRADRPAPVREVSPDQFTHLKELIQPCAGEDRWARAPWMTSLWEARRRAAAEGKPILLWEMDGHPLGCT